MTKDEALMLALDFIEETDCGTADLEAQIKEALAQPEQEPVACRFCFSKKGRWTWQCYNCGEIDDVQQPATPLLVQPEPVTWDKPSDNFNAWWDGDRRRDNANPFQTDSFAYWAFEGWQAARLKETEK